jgi:hypothetical protein
MKYYLITVGIICGLLGIVLLIRRIHLYFSGIRATATFSKWEIRGFRHPAYHPVVRFTAHDGKEYEITSLSGSSPQPKTRDKYIVLYPHAKPQNGLVYSIVAYWLAPFVFLLFAYISWFTFQDMQK